MTVSRRAAGACAAFAFAFTHFGCGGGASSEPLAPRLDASSSAPTSDADPAPDREASAVDARDFNDAKAAKDAGVRDAANEAAAAPDASTGPYANAPTGCVQFTERSFSALVEDGWSAPAGNAAITEDDAGPESPPYVIQAQYQPGLAGGSTPFAVGKAVPANATEVYGAIWIKYSSNWVSNGSGVSKILYIWDDDGPYGQPVMYLDAQSDAPTGMPFRPQMNLQNNISSEYVDYSPNVLGQTGYTFARDTWVKWEFYLRHNTPGMSDGVIRVWMNGTKTHEYTDVQMAGTEMFTTQRHWVTMQFAPYWGGTGSSVSSLQYLYMDHLYGCAD